MTGKEVEYQSLRNAILHSDRICLTIVGYLLSVTMACYGIIAQFNVLILLPVLSIIWLIGFWYLTEKRFIILRHSYYLREKVESEKEGLFWQNWLRDSRKDLDKTFIRRDPYYLEMILSIIFPMANTFLSFTAKSDNWDFQFVLSVTNLIYAGISFIILVLLLIQVKKAYNKYKAIKQLN